MEDHYLESRGIAYRTNTIDPTRETFLFVHGLSGSASAWFWYEKQFENKFNIITFDLRGHGKSVRPKKYSEYHLDYFVGDIQALLEHLQIKNCISISHSFGTQIALRHAIANSDTVSKIIFLAPVYGLRRLWHMRLTKFLWIVISYVMPTMGRRTRIDYNRFGFTADFDARRVWADVTNTGLWSYFSCLRRSYDADDARWKNLNVPALMVHGTDDGYVPIAHARELANITKTKLVEIKGANHILPLNNKEEVLSAIEGFVKVSGVIN